MKTLPRGLQAIVELGLTNLETKAYVFLLGHSPSTGYAVAKALGTATANTYKALDSLHDKGAIVIEDGATRLCRAVAAEEFLAHLDRRHHETRTRAAEALSRLTPSESDERVYHLKTAEHVYERFRHLLKNCEKVALLDLFPQAVERLKADIEVAGQRGVVVLLKVYQPVKLSNTNVVLTGDGDSVLRKWPCIWANGVFDGKEHLLALLSSDERQVHQAVWSASNFVSWVYHCALSFEMRFAAEAQIGKSMPKRLIQMLHGDTPGYHSLMERVSRTALNTSSSTETE